MTHAGKFKVAMVGISTESAKDFLSEIFHLHTTKLVAVCDKNPRSLKEACETYLVSGYHSYEDLIENEKIDFAIITIQKAR